MKKIKRKIFVLMLFIIPVLPALVCDHYILREETVMVANIKDAQLVPGGICIGVSVDIDGVLIAGLSDKDNKKPLKNAGFREGDIITAIEDKAIKDISDIEEVMESLPQEDKDIRVTVEAVRGNRTHKAKVTLKRAEDDSGYKLGGWLRDQASGIGTLTYIDPQTKTFGALGHGITDSGSLLPIDGGSIMNSEVISVNKGEKGIPGELRGIFVESGDDIGRVKANTTHGIFGEAEVSDSGVGVKGVTTKEELEVGYAQIMSDINGGRVEYFDAEIERIMKYSTDNSKGMIIRITDEELLEKTGGIVQGMSGSPIIQNDKIAGAVTHVFVNDPTRGYGILIENMIKEE